VIVGNSDGHAATCAFSPHSRKPWGTRRKGERQCLDQFAGRSKW